MMTHQREAAILERLRAVGSVTVVELSRLLDVSGATIRRDLERLELSGSLRRVHGGALAPSMNEEMDVLPDVDDDTREKEAIAVRAAELVADGDVVLLDIGITTMRIARHLRGRDITVITNSLAVLDALRDDESVSLVLLGGMVGRKPRTLVGPLTEETLGMVRANIAFISSTGVRPDGSIVVDLSQEASIKMRLLQSADRVVLTATTAKFPGSGSLRIGHLSDVAMVIATEGADPATLALCEKAGGEVLIVAA
ncbi:DeoR/GlpR family DNA-binding transcription regulator [Leifsonia sp. NPDC058248]|uniref:DeoR/GlpR family DNA-binding transcription regulator n=1 Tax=Leifsonia sp. NPDC058248 TaxID=3346402 RepID=UPI0036DA12F6